MKPHQLTEAEWRNCLEAVGMSRVPPEVGTMCEQHAYCEDCGTHTRQVRKILAPFPGTRESSTRLWCVPGKHYVAF